MPVNKELKCKKHKTTFEEGETCPQCDEESWDPSQPLADEDEEAEAVARARAHARYEHLKGSELAKLQDKNRKKKTGSGSRFED